MLVFIRGTARRDITDTHPTTQQYHSALGVADPWWLLIPAYCRVTRVGNTDDIQTEAAGQTGRTPKTID